METVSDTIEKFSQALVETERLRLQQMKESSRVQIEVAKLSEQRQIEVAKLDDQRHERTEKTNRLVMPIAAVGVVVVVSLALYRGVLLQSAPALATLAMVVEFISRKWEERPRRRARSRVDSENATD